MSWVESARRATRRVDVQVAWALALRFTPLVALVLGCLYAFSADELLELVSRRAESRLDTLATAVGEPSAAARRAALEQLGRELGEEAAGFVIRDDGGGVLARGGEALEAGHARRLKGFHLAAVRLSKDDHVVFERTLAGGSRLQLVLAMRAFAREREDIERGFWTSLAIGIVLVALVSLPATRRALQPLRQATEITSAVDLPHLDTRLPVRGTGDDVDRHAIAANRLLDRLEKGFARLRAYMHDIAHELRTPINRILNVSEVSLLQAEGDPGMQEALREVRHTAGQMRRLIEGLLFLAENADGDWRVDGGSVAISDLFRVVADLYAPVCDERGRSLDVAEGHGTVRGDSALLLRAIGNLLDNAIVYTPPGGTIRLESIRIRNTIRIVVTDSGRGIPAGERERVFERFVRLEPDAAEGGRGLGLPIARAVARAHGGDLWAEPGSPSGGRFVVELPLADT